MALVLILSGVVAGLSAALCAWVLGAGFLLSVVAYLAFGALGMLASALTLWRHSTRRAPTAPPLAPGLQPLR